MKKLSILLTNDDGIHAPGIAALFKALKKIAKVTIVAPLEEKSGAGHAITFTNPLRIVEINKNKTIQGFGVNGTPADCIKIGIYEIFKKRPDMVISGINHGPNTSTLLFYSGTVAAAMEGAILGIPSIAVSVATYDKNPDFKYPASFTCQIVKKVQKEGLPKNTLLNINLPNVAANKIKGITITKQAEYCFKEYFNRKKDTRNQPYFWMGMKTNTNLLQNHIDSDMTALKKQRISITPLKCDLTDYDFLRKLKAWRIQKSCK